ncbi:MAG TPA: pantoate--beta-alanine ligase [Acidobacteriota bacterium]|nr:pantoate--beta-alanine ligase [Acidobacteriota bacterium]
MRTTGHFAELRTIRKSMEGDFGLVPTMGALHAGHASLVARAKSECEYVGVSIFVNPAQFASGEDLEKYPRTIQQDLTLLESLGVDVVWVPTVESIYPPGFQTWITVDELSLPLEGICRPGHFRGMTTIVAKLLNSFMPDRAYFGQKDAQQAAVIKRMVMDLHFSVEIVVCPTVREQDGLAISSRNAYLDHAERAAATVLYRALSAAKEKYAEGERDAESLLAVMRGVIASEPLAREEYAAAVDPETFCAIKQVERHVLLLLAAHIGKTRLIDNMLL